MVRNGEQLRFIALGAKHGSAIHGILQLGVDFRVVISQRVHRVVTHEIDQGRK